METDKMAMNKGLLASWLEAVHEKDLPVNIQTGRTTIDGNGDRMVEILMEYEPEDKDLIYRSLEETTNTWAGLV